MKENKRKLNKKLYSTINVDDSYYTKFIKCLKIGVKIEPKEIEDILNYKKSTTKELLNALEYYKLLQLVVKNSKIKIDSSESISEFMLITIIQYIEDNLEIRSGSRGTALDYLI